MSGQETICLTSSNLVLASNDGVSGNGDKAVDVSSKINLDHVALLNDDVGVAGQGGEVADAVVHGDAAGKCNA